MTFISYRADHSILFVTLRYIIRELLIKSQCSSNLRGQLFVSRFLHYRLGKKTRIYKQSRACCLGSHPLADFVARFKFRKIVY